MPFDGKKAAPLATGMALVFGNDGEGWIKGTLLSTRLGQPDRSCLMGAAMRAGGRSTWEEYCEEDHQYASLLWQAIKRAFPTMRRSTSMSEFGAVANLLSVQDWNDRKKRTFADIRKVLDALAEIEVTGNVG